MSDESDVLGEPGLGDAGLDAAGLDAAGLDMAGGLDAGLVEAAGLDASGLEEGAAGLRLSAEESEALLDAISSGADAGGARAASLGSADEPMRRALRRADEVLPVLETSLRDTLVRAGTPPTEIGHEPSSVVTYEALSSSIDRSAAVWLVHSGDPSAPLGLVVIGTAVAGAMLERRLGASAALIGSKAIERAPSAFERRVLEPLAREVLAVAIAPFVEDTKSLVLAAHRSESGTISHFAPCLRMYVRLALKNDVASDVVVALFSATFNARPSAALGRGQVRVIEAVEGVEVDAVAVLGRCRSTVRELLSLVTGSVLRLDGAPDRPVEVQVDGVPVLRGMPVVKDGNMAIEVRT